MMLSRLGVLGFVAALTAVTAACSAQSDGDAAGATATSTGEDLKLGGARVLGTIENGEPRNGNLFTPPTRLAYLLTARAGDIVTINVTSHNGDAVAYLTDGHDNILAYNDDAMPGTHDAQIVYQIPAALAECNLEVIFSDYNNRSATFDVAYFDQSGVVCTYGGNDYGNGDTFPADDGCNTCTCTMDGISCSKQICACNGQNGGGLTYYGTPEQCKTMSFNCPANQVRFSNDCGCGCEILTTTHPHRGN